MTPPPKKVISVRYRAPTGTTTIKNAVYNGIRIRESDSAVIMALSHPEDQKSFTVDIGNIDTIWIGGKARKLKSPGSQHKFREAEIKHLLDNKTLDSWTDPYLREYQLEGAMPKKQIGGGLIRGIVSTSGMALMVLPALACIGVGGFIAYMAWKLFINAK